MLTVHYFSCTGCHGVVVVECTSAVLALLPLAETLKCPACGAIHVDVCLSGQTLVSVKMAAGITAPAP